MRAFFPRFVAVLVAALCIVTQGASFAHLLLVRHVACAAHQNLMEEGGEASATNPPNDQNQTAAQTPEQQNQHSDEQCALCAQRTKLLLTPPSATPLALLTASSLLPRAPSALTIPTSEQLFLLAPKNSPPLL